MTNLNDYAALGTLPPGTTFTSILRNGFFEILPKDESAFPAKGEVPYKSLKDGKVYWGRAESLVLLSTGAP